VDVRARADADTCLARARELLKPHAEAVSQVASRLLAARRLSGEKLVAVLDEIVGRPAKDGAREG